MIVGIGTDIVVISRIERLVERYGPRFLNKVYTEREQEISSRRGNAAEAWAARFAGKEAVMKALGTGWTGGVKFREIEILPDPRGKPEITLHGRTAEVAAERGATRSHISLSHDQDFAVAFAILETDGPSAGA